MSALGCSDGYRFVVTRFGPVSRETRVPRLLAFSLTLRHGSYSGLFSREASSMFPKI